MAAVADSILEKIPHLPESPGVYLWRDADGNVLYVGKAKRLRSRVRSYANLERIESVKTYALMNQVAGRNDRRSLGGARADSRSEPHQGVQAPLQHFAARRQELPAYQSDG